MEVTKGSICCCHLSMIGSWVNANQYVSAEEYNEKSVMENIMRIGKVTEDDVTKRDQMMRQLKSGHGLAMFSQRLRRITLLALCNGSYQVTQHVLEPLVKGRPHLTPKLLRKPPFRFVADIVRKVVAYHFDELPPFMVFLKADTKIMTPDEKLLFLNALIKYVDNLIDQFMESANDTNNDSPSYSSIVKVRYLQDRISAKRILAGVHPDHTNILLTLIGLLFPLYCSNSSIFTRGNNISSLGSISRSSHVIKERKAKKRAQMTCSTGGEAAEAPLSSLKEASLSVLNNVPPAFASLKCDTTLPREDMVTSYESTFAVRTSETDMKQNQHIPPEVFLDPSNLVPRPPAQQLIVSSSNHMPLADGLDNKSNGPMQGVSSRASPPPLDFYSFISSSPPPSPLDCMLKDQEAVLKKVLAKNAHENMSKNNISHASKKVKKKKKVTVKKNKVIQGTIDKHDINVSECVDCEDIRTNTMISKQLDTERLSLNDLSHEHSVEGSVPKRERELFLRNKVEDRNNVITNATSIFNNDEQSISCLVSPSESQSVDKNNKTDNETHLLEVLANYEKGMSQLSMVEEDDVQAEEKCSAIISSPNDLAIDASLSARNQSIKPRKHSTHNERGGWTPKICSSFVAKIRSIGPSKGEQTLETQSSRTEDCGSDLIEANLEKKGEHAREIESIERSKAKKKKQKESDQTKQEVTCKAKRFSSSSISWKPKLPFSSPGKVKGKKTDTISNAEVLSLIVASSKDRTCAVDVSSSTSSKTTSSLSREKREFTLKKKSKSLISYSDDKSSDKDEDVDMEDELPDELWKIAGIDQVFIERKSIYDPMQHLQRKKSTSTSSLNHSSSRTMEDKSSFRQPSVDEDNLMLLAAAAKTKTDNENVNNSNLITDICETSSVKRKANVTDRTLTLSGDAVNRIKNRDGHSGKGIKINFDEEFDEWEESWKNLKKWLKKKKEEREKQKNDIKYGSTKSTFFSSYEESSERTTKDVNDCKKSFKKSKPSVPYQNRLVQFIDKYKKIESDSKQSKSSEVSIDIKVPSTSEENSNPVVTLEHIPWPEEEEDILSISSNESMIDKKQKLKRTLLFWHPDHFKKMVVSIQKLRSESKSTAVNNKKSEVSVDCDPLLAVTQKVQQELEMVCVMERAHEVIRRIIIEKNKMTHDSESSKAEK